MSRGPNGERRPADAVGCAVMVAKIATSECEEMAFEQPQKRAGGRRGGQRRAEVLPAAQRSGIAKQGATARWHG